METHIKISYLIISIVIVYIIKSFYTRKRKNYYKVFFKIKDDFISLSLGETHKYIKNKRFYQEVSCKIINTINSEIKEGKYWKSVIREKFKDSNSWLFNIILSNKRTYFFDLYIRPKNLRILDIGSGWGQFTIPFAKNNLITCMEPNYSKLEFIKSVAKQENVMNNISFICSNYFDLNFVSRFDLILSIGVLEWCGKYNDICYEPEFIQRKFLKNVKNNLSRNGKLIIGIENRIGLKYLFGAKDDHIGLSNISYLRTDFAKKKYKDKTSRYLKTLTYTLFEYKNILKDCNFKKIKIYAALPDYKVPTHFFSIKQNLKKSRMNDYILSGGMIIDHDGTNGKILQNMEELNSIYYTLAEMNISHYFAPSFYIIAS